MQYPTVDRIDHLTQQQLDELPAIRDEWIRIGLSTDPPDRPRAERAIRWMYRRAALPQPRIVWCGSPMSQALARAASLHVLPDVSPGIGGSVGESVRNSVRDSVGNSVYSAHDAHWLSFYAVMRHFGLHRQTDSLRGLWALARSAGWALPHRGICWISERHVTLVRNEIGQLHRVGGPAIAYPDGWEIHVLHGVRVPAWLAETPEPQLDPKQVLTLGNVEQRREGIQRVGIERMLTVLSNRVLDESGDYALLSIKLSDDALDCRYLKMRNPSIGVWHLEGVHPSCSTVEQAINWRVDEGLTASSENRREHE